MKNPRILGVILFVLLIGGIAGYQFWKSQGPRCGNMTATGRIGSEKTGLFSNPEVLKILSERYCIKEVKVTTGGSIEIVEGDTAGLDFISPSNAVALELYKQRGGKGQSEIILNSPIVLYSWKPVADALIAQGVVQKVNDVYYVVDMPKLTDLMMAGTAWSDIGLPQIYGKLTVISTDPTVSNSGNMFFLLLGAMLNGGTVVDTQSVEVVAPKLYQYYQGLGYMETGSGKLFKQFVAAGMGDKPLIAGYENQVVEFILENPTYRDTILQQIVIMYPKPTVWASHPLIALTPNGQALLAAMQDKDIQAIAWRQHGFRTGLAGVQNNPADLGLSGLPLTIDSVMPLPRPDVVKRIIEYLQNGR